MSDWFDADLLDARWRPVADDVVARMLAARERERLPHALLLVGPEGLGRELAAVEVAASLVCADADAGCRRRVVEGVHPDVELIAPVEGATEIKVAQIREVVDSAPSRPYEGQYRVFIVAGVEAGGLGPSAANAFLKVLEEPPDHVRFLLLAANPDGVLATIRSRCQQLRLPGAVAMAADIELGPTPPELAVAAAAGVDVAAGLAPVAEALAALGEGDVRPALCLPQRLPDGVSFFELSAAAAISRAADLGEDEAAGLIRLAARLLTTEAKVRALNLNPERQLVACLLGWMADERS